MTNVFIAGGGGSGVGSDDCTATAADVRKGKTFIGAGTDDETGVGTLDVSDFDLDGTAVEGDVIKGKTFFSDNAASKRTGTIPSNSTDGTVALAQNSGGYCSLTFPYGYYPRYTTGQNNTRMRITNASLASAIGLTANRIAKGSTIIGVQGTYTTPLSGNAAAGDVISGKTFYSSDAGTKQTGTMKSYASGTEGKSETVYEDKLYIRYPVGAYLTQYNSVNDPGMTEIQRPMSSVRTTLGIDANYILTGHTMAGVAGVLTCQTIVNFNAAMSGAQIHCTWQLPARGPLTNVAITLRTDRQPTTTTDGTQFVASSFGQTSLDITPPEGYGKTYYITVWSQVYWSNIDVWEQKQVYSGSINVTTKDFMMGFIQDLASRINSDKSADDAYKSDSYWSTYDYIGDNRKNVVFPKFINPSGTRWNLDGGYSNQLGSSNTLEARVRFQNADDGNAWLTKWIGKTLSNNDRRYDIPYEHQLKFLQVAHGSDYGDYDTAVMSINLQYISEDTGFSVYVYFNFKSTPTASRYNLNNYWLLYLEL